MVGAVLGVFLVALVIVLIALGLPAVILVPIVVVGLAAVFLLPGIFGALGSGGRGGGGVPTTSQASYDPVAESQRSPGDV